MQTTTYKIVETSPKGVEQYSKEDIKIVDSFEINSIFNSKNNKIEYHIYSLDGELLDSDYNYINESFLQGSGTAGTDGASEITIDPIQDIKSYGYPYGGVSTVYNFTNDLYSVDKTPIQFYINEISEDRTEIRLLTNLLDNSKIVQLTSDIKEKLDNTSYFNDFRVNVGNNDLLIGINIDTQNYRDYKSVIVKLYEPLPDTYQLKDLLTIEEVVNDTLGYEIEAQTIQDEIKIPVLKGPNFNVELDNDASVVPSEFFNYNELFSYPTENSYRELNSLFSEKGVNISINYSDYSEFINFSSANERLRNFKYKLDLIEAYQIQLDRRKSTNSSQLSGSQEFYKNQIDNIVNNFDHFDRHLYYESGSSSWPKVNSSKPYTNATGSLTGSWYNENLENTQLFDSNNVNQLLNTVPAYLREDTQNAPYEMYIHMIGQHFDNLWVYTKAVTDKYDNDNRVNSGISRDLVEDALKNFGVKLYTSNKSLENLFNNFTGELYNTGSEQITTFVSASNNPTSEDTYRKEIYKRLYHNLPLLLKGKGTERGLRALINSFGIPTSYSEGSQYGLSIKTAGGTNTTDTYNLGPEQINTSSLLKIRIDNTGSIIEGNTLSSNTSIVKRDKIYTDDLHSIEVGYSPTDVINERLLPFLSSSEFNIDNYIGDPGQVYSSSYQGLISQSNSLLQPLMVSGSHDLQDFTRILKFYDNVIFKTVKDFLPARSNVSTGIIVKPHLLERNKVKQVQGTFTQNLITGSISIGEYSGSDGQSYQGSITKTTNYTSSYMTSGGVALKDDHLRDQAKYDGELSGSYIKVSESELPPNNPFKYVYSTEVRYKVNIISQSLDPTATPTPTSTSTPTPAPATDTPTPTPTSTGVPATDTPTPTPSPTPTPQTGLTGLANGSGQSAADQAAINWYCSPGCKETIYWASPLYPTAGKAIYNSQPIYSDSTLSTPAPAGTYYTDFDSGEAFARYWTGSGWVNSIATYITSCTGTPVCI